MFPLVDTHGIPLDLVLDKLRDHGLMPDWLDFYDTATSRGWKPSGVVTKLSEAVGDVYGPEFRVAWEKRFSKLLESRK